ncbi:uncharacterized protein LOC114843877 [Betta splendens]|uniref:Uncharacterized protein LOC114843877 n=1 Tax=Betta splendens TaxID=158456 RepID=A0A9W2XBW5_BETSP|nr:uncharacterized protein LOC114843877 [Betta splendens]
MSSMDPLFKASNGTVDTLLFSYNIGSETGAACCVAADLRPVSALNVTHLLSSDVTNVTAEPGRDATLPCTGSVHTDILTVEWRRAEEIVCVNTRPESSAQCENEALPSLQNRVQLSSGSKERDVSLVLNNVTNEDDGTYECYVQHTIVGGNHRERPDEMTLLCTVHLQVEPALPCTGSVHTDILTVEWRRAEEIVCVNTRPESSAQCENEALPSFQNRVQLSSGSKERDVSLVLNNVTNEDDGTYKCYVQHNNVGGNHRERPDEMTLLCTVHLQVEPGGSEPGGQETAQI